MYNWTVFMPRMTCPTCDSMLLADTTRANAGSFVNSCSCGLHFRSSDRSTFVPNLRITKNVCAYKHVSYVFLLMYLLCKFW